jgi:AcrR family transcriptional regulator
MRIAVDHREAILQTAAKLFAKKPFHAVLMDDVAEKTGIAKGTIYRHFPNKDELFAALSLRHLDILGEAVGEIAASSGEPLARLEKIVLRLIEIIVERRDFFQVMQRHECDFVNKGSLFAMRRRVTRDHIAGVINEAVAKKQLRIPFETVTAADILMGMIRSILRFTDPQPTPEKCTEMVLHVFLKGLAAGNGRGGSQ